MWFFFLSGRLVGLYYLYFVEENVKGFKMDIDVGLLVYEGI